MINTLLGIKKGMVSSYDSRGRRVGATLIEVAPNLVTQVKTEDGKDGYNSVQLGLGEKKSVRKPQIGHLKKAGIEKKVRFLRETRVKEASDDLKMGQEVRVEQIFSAGDAVKVTGVSKGRGFQGGVKRHGFHGGPKTHGQSDRHRAPGSIGSGTTPGRVYKGKKMAGHMGVDQVSYKGLEVIAVNKNDNLVTLKGGVPGPVGGLVILQNIGKVKGYTPPPEEKEEEEESIDSAQAIGSEAEPQAQARRDKDGEKASEGVSENNTDVTEQGGSDSSDQENASK